jgi:hypothetical protein
MRKDDNVGRFYSEWLVTFHSDPTSTLDHDME